ncbi:hypothetical protein SAMN04487906_2511 [Zhouia amylolytica]|uniref:Uncharacterized protein n=1 Tax=Zhouia amylolytica TaxID=376730 RepID=A0A1I6UJ88_9FLAO|nr:DUF6146 family protein [Zhouia amylolytica]SFT01471.1 hypothetical protein SAMN04487906_2511 [Zhouia amylolytica]
MKYIVSILFLFMLIWGCSSSKEALNISEEEKSAFNTKESPQDTVKIANDSLEYEIIIIDPGFYTWLNSIAKPRGFYSQNYLENRNQIYVINWNQRVMQPMRYSPNLYEMQIDYRSDIDYGYEANYQLYNYFIYFQRKYNQRLGPFYPRIN